VVLVESSTQYVTVWELQRFRYDGQQVVVERKGCGSDMVAEVYSPLYEEVYSSSVPNFIYDGLPLEPASNVTLAKSDALPMHPFVTPRQAIVLGVHLNDPLNDAWPMTSADVPSDAWVDTEHDGELGITLWPEPTTKLTLKGDTTYSYLPAELEDGSTIIAVRVGCVSTAIRSIGNLDGRIESCGRMTGKVNTEKTEGRVHSCQVLRMADWDGLDVTCSAQDWANARRCNKDQISFLDQQDQTTEATADFEMIKIADADATDIDCAAVRKALPAIPR
jgi:hypothetical protein